MPRIFPLKDLVDFSKKAKTLLESYKEEIYYILYNNGI